MMGVFTNLKDAEDFMAFKAESVTGHVLVTRLTQGGLHYNVEFVDTDFEYDFCIEESFLLEKIAEK
jgi:hypothetical protein